MSQLLSSVPVTNTGDYIKSIGTFTFPEDTKIEDAPNAEGIACVLEASEGDVFLTFATEEGESVVVTFENQSQEEYFKDSKNHVTPIIQTSEGILFGGHPKPRPPKVVS